MGELQPISKGFETRASVGLSWIERDLKAAASSALQTAIEARMANRQLADLNWTAATIAAAVHALERSLGLELATQTKLLGSQAASLLAIESAVTSPRRTEALERVAQASTLLEQRRFEFALRCARDAIDADPTNPHAFVAAAWAATALGDYEAAQRAFEEAIAASDGAARLAPARQAARLAYASGDARRARALIEDVIADAERDEAGALYDLALYCAATGDRQLASERMRTACALDTRFGMMALVDEAVSDFPDLRACAVAAAQETIDDRTARLAAATERLTELSRRLPPLHPGWGEPELATWRTALSGVDAQVAKALELETDIEGPRDEFEAELAAIIGASAQLAPLLSTLVPLSRQLTIACRVGALTDLLSGNAADWITASLMKVLRVDETIDDAATYTAAEGAVSRPALWSDEAVEPVDTLAPDGERILLVTSARLLWTTVTGSPVNPFDVMGSLLSTQRELVVERALRDLPYEDLIAASAMKKRKLELTLADGAPTITFKIGRWPQADVDELADYLDSLVADE